jgi:magnesium transporter
MGISCRVFHDGVLGDELEDLSGIGDHLRAAENGDGWLWLDVVDPTVVDLATLQEQLELHPLAVEDSRHRGQRPKVELYENHVFVVLRPLSIGDDGRLDETEVHAFVSKRFLVTLRFTPSIDIRPVARRLERSGELGGGTAAALYCLEDEVADGYLAAVEHLEDRVDDLEDRVFGRGRLGDDEKDLQAQILHDRRAVVRLRRLAMPTRQGLDLLQEDLAVSSRLYPYYRDVAEHLLRAVELADGVRDVLTTILEIRTAQAANQLNEVMKKLTAWAGIILVPTLIAGIYGMNFNRMPELHWVVGYPLALGMMAASAVVLYVLFRRNGWL